MDDFLARIMGYANQGTAPFGALAEPSPDIDPNELAARRVRRGVVSPSRAQPPMPPGMTTSEVGTALKQALVGNPDATVPMRVDESGRPVAHKSLEAFSEDYPGETHPAVEAGANLGLTYAGRALEPAYLAARAAMAAPKTAAGVIGATAVAAPSMAGEQQFKWSDPVPERVKEMDAIQKRINDRAEKITTLGTTSTKSPAGTQKLAIDQLSALNRPDSPDVSRLTQLRNESGADRDTAFKQWQADQETAREEAIARKKADTSLFDMVPGTRSAIAVGTPLVAGLGGYGLGKKLGPLKGMVAGGLGGAGEGFASMVGPTEVDYRLPRTSPAQKEAASDLVDPEYWGKRVPAITGMNAVFGALGGFKGGMSRRAPLPISGAPSKPSGPLSATASGPSIPGASPNIPAVPQPAGPSPTSALSTASQASPPPAIVPYQDNLGLWRDRNTGRFAPKPPTP